MISPGGVICACAAVVAAVGGCTAGSSSSVTATGKTLTIYASAPPGAGGQDVLGGEQLALRQSATSVGGFTIKFAILRHAKTSDNARVAIEDKGAIAYLGEIAPGASEASLGITNAQDLLQVTPTDTAVEETQSTSAVAGSPSHYYEALKVYGRTFARVVPNSAHEARATVAEMQAQGVKSVYVADDGSDYGRAIAAAVRNDAAPAITIASSPGSADGAFYGGSDPARASRLLAGNPTVKLFLPSALADAAGQLAGSGKVYVSTPGVLASELSSAGRRFVSDFRAQYGRDPSWSAVFGYAAMSAVLDAIRKAGASANNRATVVDDFFDTHTDSVLGTYKIDGSGDTSFASFVFSRVKGGRLVPYKSAQG